MVFKKNEVSWYDAPGVVKNLILFLINNSALYILLHIAGLIRKIKGNSIGLNFLL